MLNSLLNELAQQLLAYKKLKNELLLELEGLEKADWEEDDEMRVREIEKKTLLLEAINDKIVSIEDIFKEEKINEMYEQWKTER